MKGQDRLSLMLFPERSYPFSHSILTKVYGKLFVQKGHNVVWIVHSTDPIAQKRFFNWNWTKVYLLQMLKEYKTIFGKIMKIRIFLQNLWSLMQIIKKERIDIVQVRNLPWYGLFGILTKIIYGTVFVFQRSIMMQAMNIEEYRAITIKAIQLRIAYLRFEAWLVYMCMHLASLVLPISDTMKDELESKI